MHNIALIIINILVSHFLDEPNRTISIDEFVSASPVGYHIFRPGSLKTSERVLSYGREVILDRGDYLLYSSCNPYVSNYFCETEQVIWI